MKTSLLVCVLLVLCLGVQSYYVTQRRVLATARAVSQKRQGEEMVKRLDRRLGNMYEDALKIRCPFFRRRTYDALDALSKVFRFVVARHKSLDLASVLPLGFRNDYTTTLEPKQTGLTLEQVSEYIRQDWRQDSHKGYYITGRISKDVFADNCLFDGPDPDMPVRGLKKYIASASQLFEYRSSTAELLELTIDNEGSTITAAWRIAGKLNLPWHPRIKPWTGKTTYHVNEDGLVDEHLETWDVSVAAAFWAALVGFEDEDEKL